MVLLYGAKLLKQQWMHCPRDAFLLSGKKLANDTVENFVEEDENNVMQLFRVFTDGTHGTSGKFTISQLVAIKCRVEDGIQFLHQIAI